MIKDYKRKIKEDKPVLAICYDFDKTLTPTDMQAQGFIQDMGYDVKAFWQRSNDRAAENGMDENLSYMLAMTEVARGKKYITREELARYGEKLALFPGVVEWFERVRKFGEECGVIVEHYVISSGLKEMIDGTAPARAGAFEQVYASEFYYDESGAAIWPAQVVNFTNKTQFLFRIEKGVLDKNDPTVNDSFPPEAVRVPFCNMVYIGDSDTDVPCMSLIDRNGGHSVGVYDPQTCDKNKVYKMMREGRIKFFAPADYSEGSELDDLIQKIIIKVAYSEVLKDGFYAKKAEAAKFYDSQDKASCERRELIFALEDSRSFSSTHSAVSGMMTRTDWTQDEIAELFHICATNSQVFGIINDRDVKTFYNRLLKRADQKNKNVKDAIAEFDAVLDMYGIEFS